MKKCVMIGCGNMGGSHLNDLVKLKGIELAGFCDIAPKKAESFAKKAGCGKAYTDFKTMYDETRPDMVYICVPPHEHGEIEFETIERGIHMFVEKPVTNDLTLANKINDKIKEKGIITAVGFQCRYDNINDAAKEYISKNDIVVAQGSRVGGIPGAEWWNKKSLSGGMLVEAAIHQVDIMRYFFGEADTVYSTARRGFVGSDESPGYDTDDVSISLITFKNGLSFTFIAGCHSLENASWNSNIMLGSRSSRLEYKLASNIAIFGQDGKGEEIVKTNGTFGYECDETFINAVISGDASKIRSPYADGLKTLALTLACNESMETGKAVKVPE